MKYKCQFLFTLIACSCYRSVYTSTESHQKLKQVIKRTHGVTILMRSQEFEHWHLQMALATSELYGGQGNLRVCIVWIGNDVITEDLPSLDGIPRMGIPHPFTSALRNPCRSSCKVPVTVVWSVSKLESEIGSFIFYENVFRSSRVAALRQMDSRGETDRRIFSNIQFRNAAINLRDCSTVTWRLLLLCCAFAWRNEPRLSLCSAVTWRNEFLLSPCFTFTWRNEPRLSTRFRVTWRNEPLLSRCSTVAWRNESLLSPCSTVAWRNQPLLSPCSPMFLSPTADEKKDTTPAIICIDCPYYSCVGEVAVQCGVRSRQKKLTVSMNYFQSTNSAPKLTL